MAKVGTFEFAGTDTDGATSVSAELIEGENAPIILSTTPISAGLNDVNRNFAIHTFINATNLAQLEAGGQNYISYVDNKNTTLAGWIQGEFGPLPAVENPSFHSTFYDTSGPRGATGATGPSGASEPQYASVTTQQNADGSTSTTYTGGSYFDGKPYYSVTDTTAADGTPESEVRYRNNGATTIALFTSGQTQDSVYYDTFYAEGTGSDTFVFKPGHGADVVNGFQAGGPNHDTLSFASSDFSSIAAILHNTTDTSAGAVIQDPTGNGDTVQLTGISKADLAANARQDFKLHG